MFIYRMQYSVVSKNAPANVRDIHSKEINKKNGYLYGLMTRNLAYVSKRQVNDTDETDKENVIRSSYNQFRKSYTPRVARKLMLDVTCLGRGRGLSDRTIMSYLHMVLYVVEEIGPHLITGTSRLVVTSPNGLLACTVCMLDQIMPYLDITTQPTRHTMISECIGVGVKICTFRRGTGKWASLVSAFENEHPHSL